MFMTDWKHTFEACWIVEARLSLQWGESSLTAIPDRFSGLFGTLINNWNNVPI